MQVLLIPEYSLTGGTGTFFFRLLDIHSHNKIKTGIIIPEAQADDRVLSVCREKGFQVFIVPNRKPLFFEAYASLVYDLYYYRKIIKNFLPDIIVVSNGTPGINLGVFFLGYPVLFIMHTLPKKTSWKTIGMKFVTRFLSGRKKSFVTVSEYASKKIQTNMCVPEKNIDVVYNSCKTINAITDTQNESIVLTVGHVVRYKNPVTWLEVAKKVVAFDNTVIFIWLGNGTLLESMRKEVKQLKLENNIIFNGYESNVKPFYQKAKIYFQPSRVESHGISVLDAMAFELPCIVSDAGGLPESVSDNETGFACAFDDVTAFSERIKSCLIDSELSSRMGKAGKERAKKYFNDELQEKKILRLYNEKVKKDSTG